MPSPPIIADTTPERATLNPSKLGQEKRAKFDRSQKTQKAEALKHRANPQSSLRAQKPEQSLA